MLELLVLASPEQLAAWVNKQLKLTPSNRVGPRHPGIDRLARWVDNRSTTGSSRIRPKEFLEHVRRWLPDLFEGVEIYPQDLRFDCWPKVAEVETEPPPEESDRREEKALNELTASKPKRRIRGLKLLAHLGNEDLFDWCVMSLDDESLEVRIAALHAMIHCDAAYPEVILPFAESEDKRIRAAAIAALAKHSGEEAHRWFERGLKDREACVRLEAAALLPQLDPAEHRALFELARHDPNPEIKDLAKGLTAGKGFHEMRGREHRGNEAI
jgi:hypothetical protein